jgi:hypothetical protein
MDRRRISGNGAWRRAPLPPVSPVPPRAARWLRARYELSAFGVALACLMAAAGELAISHPPLLLLAAAVAVASSLFSFSPGMTRPLRSAPRRPTLPVVLPVRKCYESSTPSAAFFRSWLRR